MKKKLTTYLLVAVFSLTSAIGMLGCSSDAKTGALFGAGGGAAAGAAIDHRNRGRGALIGAGIGAIGGYLIGNESDKSKAKQNEYPRRYER